MILDYNKHMGGFDVSDKMVCHYASERSSRSYWKRIFQNLMDIFVLNSWILYNLFNPQKNSVQGQHSHQYFGILVWVNLPGTSCRRSPPWTPTWRQVPDRETIIFAVLEEPRQLTRTTVQAESILAIDVEHVKRDATLPVKPTLCMWQIRDSSASALGKIDYEHSSMLLLILLLNSTVFIDLQLFFNEYYNIIENKFYVFTFFCLQILKKKKELDSQRKLLKI